MTEIKRGDPLNRANEIQENGDTEFRFQLDSIPTVGWIDYFNHHYNVLDSDFKPAGIRGNCVWVTCHFTNLKKIYLPRVDAAIAAANKIDTDLRGRFDADQAKKRALEEAEIAKKQEFLDSLKK